MKGETTTPQQTQEKINDNKQRETFPVGVNSPLPPSSPSPTGLTGVSWRRMTTELFPRHHPPSHLFLVSSSLHFFSVHLLPFSLLLNLYCPTLFLLPSFISPFLSSFLAPCLPVILSVSRRLLTPVPWRSNWSDWFKCFKCSQAH